MKNSEYMKNLRWLSKSDIINLGDFDKFTEMHLLTNVIKKLEYEGYLTFDKQKFLWKNNLVKEIDG